MKRARNTGEEEDSAGAGRGKKSARAESKPAADEAPKGPTTTRGAAKSGGERPAGRQLRVKLTGAPPMLREGAGAISSDEPSAEAPAAGIAASAPAGHFAPRTQVILTNGRISYEAEIVRYAERPAPPAAPAKKGPAGSRAAAQQPAPPRAASGPRWGYYVTYLRWPKRPEEWVPESVVQAWTEAAGKAASIRPPRKEQWDTADAAGASAADEVGSAEEGGGQGAAASGGAAEDAAAAGGAAGGAAAAAGGAAAGGSRMTERQQLALLLKESDDSRGKVRGRASAAAAGSSAADADADAEAGGGGRGGRAAAKGGGAAAGAGAGSSVRAEEEEAKVLSGMPRGAARSERRVAARESAQQQHMADKEEAMTALGALAAGAFQQAHAAEAEEGGAADDGEDRGEEGMDDDGADDDYDDDGDGVGGDVGMGEEEAEEELEGEEDEVDEEVEAEGGEEEEEEGGEEEEEGDGEEEDDDDDDEDEEGDDEDAAGAKPTDADAEPIDMEADDDDIEERGKARAARRRGRPGAGPLSPAIKIASLDPSDALAAAQPSGARTPSAPRVSGKRRKGVPSRALAAQTVPQALDMWEKALNDELRFVTKLSDPSKYRLLLKPAIDQDRPDLKPNAGRFSSAPPPPVALGQLQTALTKADAPAGAPPDARPTRRKQRAPMRAPLQLPALAAPSV